jgi:hypothetical protein
MRVSSALPEGEILVCHFAVYYYSSHPPLFLWQNMMSHIMLGCSGQAATPTKNEQVERNTPPATNA